MKKVKLKVKILALVAVMSITIAGGTYYATNAKQHRNISINSIELNVEKKDKDTVKIYLSNFSDLAKSLQLSVKIEDGNVKFKKNSIKWLVNSGKSNYDSGIDEQSENKSGNIQKDYKIDSSGKVLDLFIVSKDALNSDGGRIELCEIDVSKGESILDKIFKSNDGTYTVEPNVVDGEAYSYVTYSTNKRISGDDIINPSDIKLTINEEPVIKLKDNSSVFDNQIIISRGDVFNIKDYVEAFDADGNEIEKIEYTGKVDNKKVGSYNIVCSATDSSGTSKTLETIVTVEDLTSENISKPVIYGTEEYAEIYIGEEFDLEEGISAKDYMGRNLELKITGKYDIDTAGTYIITYSASDRFNNTVTAERVLIVRGNKEDDFTPDIPDNPGSGDNDNSISDIIESIMDKEVVTFINGKGTSNSPLLVEVNEVPSEKFVMFLKNIDVLERKEGYVLEDDIYKTLKLTLSKKEPNSGSVMSINDNDDELFYISIRVDKSRSELLNALNIYIDQNNYESNYDNGNDNNNSDNDNNSGNGGSNNDSNTENNNSGSSGGNSSNGNTSSSTDKKYEIPSKLEEVINVDTIKPICGNGTSESPLNVEIKNTSVSEFKGFMRNLNNFNIEIESIEEDENYKIITLKMKEKFSMANIMRLFRSSDDMYLTIKVDKHNRDFMNILDSFIADMNSHKSENNTPVQDNTSNTEGELLGNSSGGSFLDNIINGITNIFNDSSNNSSQESNDSKTDYIINNDDSYVSNIIHAESNTDYENDVLDNQADAEENTESDQENSAHENIAETEIEDVQSDEENSNSDSKNSIRKFAEDNKMIAVSSIGIICILVYLYLTMKNRRNK